MTDFSSSVPAFRSDLESEPIRLNFNRIAEHHIGSSPPSDPSEGFIWIDNTSNANVKMYWRFDFPNPHWQLMMEHLEIGGIPVTYYSYLHDQTAIGAALTWTINTPFSVRAPIVTCWDTSSPSNVIYGDVKQVSLTQITATFTVAQNGYCRVMA